jgi:ABC-type multidrug transport system ATPase subunit
MSSELPERSTSTTAAKARRRDVIQRPAEVLSVRELTKSFHRGLGPRRRRIEVLRGASMEAREGELIGLVGENGSGKSTLMKIIVGMLERDGGSVERRGELGYCPQLPLLWEKLTINEHFDLFARAYRLDGQQLNDARERLLADLQFERYVAFRVEELSGGTRQKLNLALALMHDPDLLLLDEPYAGFDWETYLRFWELSAGLRDGGMSIVIVSHLISERERLDRIYELREGRLEEG